MWSNNNHESENEDLSKSTANAANHAIIDGESEGLEEEDESSNGDHENNVTDHTLWRIKMPSLETVENLTWNSRYEERTYEDLCYVTFSSEVIGVFQIVFSFSLCCG